MPLHLLKLAVGIDDIAHLRRVRALRAAECGGPAVFTRNYPRRAAEVLDGGLMFWVIRGRIAVRERVLGLHVARDIAGRRSCRIEVDGLLVPTQSRPCRPFQGWRYLPADAAPPDCASGSAEPPPERMLAELRALGLI